MAKTKPARTEANVRSAYAELKQAAAVFAAAIMKFECEYNPDTVGLDEWIESISDTMSEIEADIDETFE